MGRNKRSVPRELVPAAEFATRVGVADALASLWWSPKSVAAECERVFGSQRYARVLSEMRLIGSDTPQPQPGKAEAPGPMKVPAEQLRTLLGITDVNYVERGHSLAMVDSTLA